MAVATTDPFELLGGAQNPSVITPQIPDWVFNQNKQKFGQAANADAGVSINKQLGEFYEKHLPIVIKKREAEEEALAARPLTQKLKEDVIAPIRQKLDETPGGQVFKYLPGMIGSPDAFEAGVNIATGLFGFLSSRSQLLQDVIKAGRSGIPPNAGILGKAAQLTPQQSDLRGIGNPYSTPLANGFYRELVARANERAAETNTKPSTGTAKTLTDIAMVIPHIIDATVSGVGNVAEAAGANPDIIALAKEAATLYLFDRIHPAAKEAMKFHHEKAVRFGRALETTNNPTSPEAVTAAKDLVESVANDGTAAAKIHELRTQMATILSETARITGNDPTAVGPLPGASIRVGDIARGAPLSALETQALGTRLTENLRLTNEAMTIGNYKPTQIAEILTDPKVPVNIKGPILDQVTQRLSWLKTPELLPALKDIGIDSQKAVAVEQLIVSRRPAEPTPVAPSVPLQPLPPVELTGLGPPAVTTVLNARQANTGFGARTPVGPPTGPGGPPTQPTIALPPGTAEAVTARIAQAPATAPSVIQEAQSFPLQQGRQQLADVLGSVGEKAQTINPLQVKQAIEGYLESKRAEVPNLLARAADTTLPSQERYWLLNDLKQLVGDARGINRTKVLTDLGATREQARTILESMKWVNPPARGTAASEPTVAETAATKEPIATTTTEQPSRRSGRYVLNLDASKGQSVESTGVIEPATSTPATPVTTPTPPEPISYRTLLPTGEMRAMKAEASTATVVPDLQTAPQTTAPVSLRYVGEKPQAIFADLRDAGVLRSLERITRDERTGVIKPERAAELTQKLQKQAEMFGVDISTAHEYPASRMKVMLERLAEASKLDLYLAERVGEEIVYSPVNNAELRAVKKLADRFDPNSKPLTLEEAQAYTRSKNKTYGTEVTNTIQEGLETLTDVSDRIPAELKPLFDELLVRAEEKVSGSTPRALGDTIQSFLDMILPPDRKPQILRHISGEGEFGGVLSRDMLTPRQREAAREIWGDIKRVGGNFVEKLKEAGFDDITATIYNRYVDSIGEFLPEPNLRAESMSFGPLSPGEKFIQLAGKKGSKRPRIPHTQAEINTIQNANPVTESEFGTSEIYYTLRKANAGVIYDSYLDVHNSMGLERQSIQKDLQALARNISPKELQEITHYALARQVGGDRLLEAMGAKAPDTLTAGQTALYNGVRRLFDTTLDRINEVNIAVGKPLIDAVDSYVPFMRAFTLAEQLGITNNFLRNTRRLNEVITHYNDIPFVHSKLRMGGRYPVETDFLKITEKYMDRALDQIYMEPFIAKVSDLVDKPLPNPKNGNLDWLMKNRNPGLYTALSKWKDFLVSGTNFSFTPRVNRVLSSISRNLNAGMLSYTLSSGASQFASMRNTWFMVGLPETLTSGGRMLSDVLSGSKEIESMRQKSKVLPTRNLHQAMENLTTGMIGSSFVDFKEAVRRGELGNIKRAVTEHGMAFMSIMDSVGAYISWDAGYRVGKRLGRDEAGAIKFADDMTIITQGGTAPGDLAPMQRSVAGRFATQFQRFLIHDWNFLVNEVLGDSPIYREIWKDSKGVRQLSEKKAASIVKNVALFLAITEAINGLYYSAGMNSPLPSPVLKTALSAADKNTLGEQLVTVAQQLSGEAIGALPVVGQVRYGQGVVGPGVGAISSAYDMLQGKPLAFNLTKRGDSPTMAAARAFGSPIGKLAFPGSRAVEKIVASEDHNMGFLPGLLGTPLPPMRRGGGTYGPNSLTGLGGGLRGLN